MRKSIKIIGLVIIGTFIFMQIAEAKGRTGSRRVYSGHGKGSHYVGGIVKK